MATNFRIGKRTVEVWSSPSEKPYIVFDETIKGFGVRVGPSGVKTFILEYRPGAGGRSVAKRRLTLGRYGVATPEQARAGALYALAQIRLGEDPQAEKARQRSSLTISGLIEAFIDGHAAKLKAKSAVNYAIALAKLRARPWRDQGPGAHPLASRRSAPSVVRHPLRGQPDAGGDFEHVRLGGSLRPLPEGHGNPAKKITRYREQGRERFLTGDGCPARRGAARGRNRRPAL